MNSHSTRNQAKRQRQQRNFFFLETAKLWLPTLYFVDGMPVAIIMLSLVLFKRFGLGVPTIMIYAALLWLPLALRPMVETLLMRVRLSPKAWIVSTQAVMAVASWAAAYTVETMEWQLETMLFLWMVTMAGVVHHVAVRRYQTMAVSRSRIGDAERLGRVFHGLALIVVVGVFTMIGGNLEVLNRNIPKSWAMVLSAVAVVLTGACCLHLCFLRKAKTPNDQPNVLPLWTIRSIFTASRQHLWRRQSVRLWLLLVLMGMEGMFGGVAAVFLVDSAHNGGTSLSPQEFGLTLGTIGVVAFVLGMVMRHRVASQNSLRKGTAVVGVAFTVQFAMFWLMSYAAPMSLSLVVVSLFVAELGHGVAMSTFFEQLDRSCGKRFQSQSRAGFVAVASLCAVVLCALSGFMQDAMGYNRFFVLTTLLMAFVTLIAGNKRI